MGTWLTKATAGSSLLYQVFFRAMLFTWNNLSYGYIIKIIFFSCAHAYSYYFFRWGHRVKFTWSAHLCFIVISLSQIKKGSLKQLKNLSASPAKENSLKANSGECLGLHLRLDELSASMFFFFYSIAFNYLLKVKT